MTLTTENRQGAAIAVVGLGCWYPGARGPREFWENVLARRRQFRRLPDCRLPLSDYHDPDPSTPDRTYGRRAAVIDGFQFDWAGQRIPRKTYEGTDVVQWFALEVARQALNDAGFDRDSAPRDRTGVILGNTLTGEHTRANTMRLRWPYVRRALLAATERKGLPPELRDELAAMMEPLYKSVFPAVTEDTLAGGLSNTIAGRICNRFDLHGGGYTVDGACSSSLLAICTAAEKLAAGRLDLALAGGVDVSLDTFELIGFAKTGALTPDDMKVYDRRANGFIPGEGCGFVVLKRLADARASGDHVYAVLQGWGISSDGKGGITAPSRAGQATAIRRAYEHSGYGPDRLDFVEGHGTGTRVGDRVELEGLASAFADLGADRPRTCGMTSLKSILGHTKAAAGVGAFIKAVIAVNRRVLPPTAGCSRPSEVFETQARTLYPILRGAIVPPARTLRAGVSAMGFGGINSHVTLESGDAPSPKLAPALDERVLLASSQETEVFVLGADSVASLVEQLPELADEASALSQAELTDLAARLGQDLGSAPAIRAALIATTPDELAGRLLELEQSLRTCPPEPGQIVAGPSGGWWAGAPTGAPRLGFLFPGQGSQQLEMTRTLVERHAWARRLAVDTDRWLASVGAGPISPHLSRPIDQAADAEELEGWKRGLARTEVAQPAVCLASLLHAGRLERLGLSPAIVGGHSLGELSALHAAGGLDAETLITLAAVRGQALAAPADRPGAMASLACPADEAERLLANVASAGVVVVANLNSPRQTVVSGDETAVLEAIARASAQGITAKRLPVSNAFHSPLLAEAAERLEREAPVPRVLPPLGVPMISGIDGQPIADGTNLPRHLASQVVSQVDFQGVARRMAERCDLLIEVGPGGVLSALVAEIVGSEGPPCLPVATRAETADRDLNLVLARAFVLGADVRWEPLYQDRLVREYVPASGRQFLDNPCERPFPEPAVDTPVGSAAAPVGSLEAALAEATGASPERMRAYLARRGRFLTEVVRADLNSLDEDAPAPAPVSVPASAPIRPTPPESEKLEPASGSGADLEAMLLDMAAEQTGFPRSSLTSEVRLLDDLNLDSIKAAELIAGAARGVGAAGLVDPSSLANASIATIAEAIQSALSGRPLETRAAAVPAPIVDDGPTWVRNFVIDFVPEAA